MASYRHLPPSNARSRLYVLNISMRSRQIAKGSLVPAGLYSVILTNPPAQCRLIKSSSCPSPLTHPPTPRPHSLSSWQPQSQRDRRQEPSFSVSPAKTLSGASEAFWGGRPRLPWSRRRCELGSARATLSRCLSELLLVLRRPLMSAAAAVAGQQALCFPFVETPDLFVVFCFFERSTSVILPINLLDP